MGLLLWIGINGIQTSIKSPTVIGLVTCLLAMSGLEMLVGPALDRLISGEKQAVRGAKAEENVGAILNSLSADCAVLHDVPAGHGNIDHLVFRKDGVIFLLETKSQRGRVTEQHGELYLNDKPVDFLKQTHRNVFWLREWLKARHGVEPWVTAAIVFPNAYVAMPRPLRGVKAINARYLTGWMQRERGNPTVAAKLWPAVEKIKAELLRGG